MVVIKDKKDCCGCNACVQKCPKQCIVLLEDSEGFSYPRVNMDVCIKCNICESVCPVLNQSEKRVPKEVFAAKNYDEGIRRESSSGGFFSAIAESILRERGVVFGARFDENWNVVHDYVEVIEELSKFRGSKYVQSVIGNSYQKVEAFLKNGRKVLFTGTSCQVAGLKRYLGRDYENLLTIDFVCHGVPSPKIWQKYLKEVVDGKESSEHTKLKIKNISFRDKSSGWIKFSLAICMCFGQDEENNGIQSNQVCIKENVLSNLYLRGFIHNLFLRPSCYKCPAKSLRSMSDITMGDYWGINIVNPLLFDDKGMNFVFVNNDKADKYILQSQIFFWKSSYLDVLRFNQSIENSVLEPRYRTIFFQKIGDGCQVCDVIKVLVRDSFVKRYLKVLLTLFHLRKK